MGKKQSMTDSGERIVFKTGAIKDAEVGKGRYDLLSPIAFHRLALWAEAGMLKYDHRSWEGGIPLSEYVDSAFRHLMKIMCGMEEEDHMAAVMWNAMALIHTSELIKRGLLPEELDDLPNYFKAEDEDEGVEFFEDMGRWVKEMVVRPAKEEEERLAKEEEEDD